ncbi:MAG: LPP20 family lipoprotein [Prevotellaceae bacterium]|jgi:metal-sulfur cluster biosynthetic enzyme|nr:LPP20 family lipoprotein [Prevotellaceae bacterium]
MNIIKKILAASILFVCSANMFAKGVDIVTLTTTAEGRTKDEAITNALRSAVEQVFGAFVSSNTNIVNDELTKDEIVTVSSGNVRKFNVLSETKLPDDNTFVLVKVEVSAVKLAKYAESKGATVEFAGATFAANIKLQQLYESNERKALQHLRTVIMEILPECYDYEINVSNPVMVGKKRWMKSEAGEEFYEIKHTVTITPNKNVDNLYKIFVNTLSGLAMTKEEIKNYISVGKAKNLCVIAIAPNSKIATNAQHANVLLKMLLHVPSDIVSSPSIAREEERIREEQTGGAKVIYTRKEQTGGAKVIYTVKDGKIRKEQTGGGATVIYSKRFYLRSGYSYLTEKIMKLLYSTKFNCVINNEVTSYTIINKDVDLRLRYRLDTVTLEYYSPDDDRVTLEYYSPYYSALPGILVRGKSGENMILCKSFSFNTRDLGGKIVFTDVYTLADIEKIKKYTVEPYKNEGGE